VHVQVHHGLARGFAGVEADVVASRRVLTVELLLDLVDQGENCALLVG